MPESREPQLDELRRRARRRLVGAVVLALAAAVLVPMLLESDPRPLGEDVAVKIPPIDEGKFVNKVGERAKSPDAPLPAPRVDPATAAPAPSSEAPKPAAKDMPAEPSAVDAPAPSNALASAEQRVLAPPARPPVKEPPPRQAGEAAKVAPVVAPEAPVKAATAPSRAEAPKAPAGASETPKAGSFSVQLAAFIDDKGANALAGRLKRSGYPAYTEPYGTSQGTLWRVRVGPYPSRDAAETARTRLKNEGQNGIIAAAK